MKKGFRPSSLLWPAILVVVFVIPVTYQDTDTFQGTMDFLFNPGEEHALPGFWHENRMLIFSGLLVAVAVFYRRTWYAFRHLIRLYQETHRSEERPSTPPVRATYLYQQSKVSCLTTWLVEMCTKGALTLHYEEGNYPWSVERTDRGDITYQEKEILDTLMGDEPQKRIKAFVSDPDPDAVSAAELLLRRMSADQWGLFHPRQSTLPAWLLLILLIAEIPFYQASMDSNMVGMLVIILFSTLISFAPAAAFCYFVADYMTGAKGLPLAMVVASLFFSLFGIHIAFSGASAPPYFETAFYPGVTAALLYLIYNLPRPPRDTQTFTPIIGYKKYLAENGHLMREEELPWSIGLGVHANTLNPPFHYSDITLPQWLQASAGTNVEEVMTELHQTLGTHVQDMVTGKTKFSRTSTTSMGEKY